MAAKAQASTIGQMTIYHRSTKAFDILWWSGDPRKPVETVEKGFRSRVAAKQRLDELRGGIKQLRKSRRRSSPAPKRRANPHAPPFAVDYFIQVVTADDRVGFLTGDGFYNTDPNSAKLFKTEAAADKAWQAQMMKVPPGTQLCIYMRKREPPPKK